MSTVIKAVKVESEPFQLFEVAVHCKYNTPNKR
jgi:hypothetical protein